MKKKTPNCFQTFHWLFGYTEEAQKRAATAQLELIPFESNIKSKQLYDMTAF